MRISAKADYAVRAMIVLARRHARGPEPVKTEEMARAAGIPAKFLEAILAQLKREGLVTSKRGAEGGYRLTRGPDAVSVADILRAVDGPLALVAGHAPAETSYPPETAALSAVWTDAEQALTETLEAATLDRLSRGAPVLDFQI
jgi:Rrf2 family protein